MGLGGLAAVLIAAGISVPERWLGLALGGSGVLLMGLMLAARLIGRAQSRAEHALTGLLAEFIEHDTAPSLITDRDGMIASMNASARKRMGAEPAIPLAAPCVKPCRSPPAC